MATAQVGSDVYIAATTSFGGVTRLTDLDGDGKYDTEGEALAFFRSGNDQPTHVAVIPEFFHAKGYYGVSNANALNDGTHFTVLVSVSGSSHATATHSLYSTLSCVLLPPSQSLST